MRFPLSHRYLQTVVIRKVIVREPIDVTQVRNWPWNGWAATSLSPKYLGWPSRDNCHSLSRALWTQLNAGVPETVAPPKPHLLVVDLSRPIQSISYRGCPRN